MRKLLVTAAAAALLIGVPATMASSTSPRSFAAAVADTSRPEADRTRDADRKPAELMAFAGVRRGAKIVELAPGGGYFTRLLSLAVGSRGRVIAWSTRPAEAVATWATSHANTTLTMGSLDTPLASEPVDLVWTTLNYHDFKNNVTDGRDAASRLNAAAFAALKPGGSYLVVDHEAAPGAAATVTNTLHRIESATVIQEVEAAGFQLAERSDLLRHAADDHTQRVVEAGIRGHTDQFVLRFVKPRGRRR